MQQTVLDAVDPAVHRQLLTLAPGILDDGGVADVRHLLGHVQLAQVVEALVLILDGLELFAVLEVTSLMLRSQLSMRPSSWFCIAALTPPQP